MRAFVDSFLDGFTGAGMFLGPPTLERAPLCAPESFIEADKELLSALHQIFKIDEDPARSGHKELIAAEIKRIILDAGVAVQNAQTVK